jgi:hypothetical protein
MRREKRLRHFLAGLAILTAAMLPLWLAGSNAQTPPPAESKQKTSKPLAGYTAILIEPFTIEISQATKDFPGAKKLTCSSAR